MKKVSQEIKFSDEVRNEILTGINRVADAVLLTLGPGGRVVVIKKDNYQTPTKDGVSVASSISLENKYQDVGAQFVIEASSRTNDISGDGKHPGFDGALFWIKIVRFLPNIDIDLAKQIFCFQIGL